MMEAIDEIQLNSELAGEVDLNVQDDGLTTNVSNLEHALKYLTQVLKFRCSDYFQHEDSIDANEIPPLAYYGDNSSFSQFIEKHEPTFDEYIILLLALTPHVKPKFLDDAIKDFVPESGDFPEMGGSRDAVNRILSPTGETAVFLLAGDDLDRRFEVQNLFTGDHWFSRKNILSLERGKANNPSLSGKLVLHPDYIELFTLGTISSPAFSTEFPAQEISTELEWDDLVLSDDVLMQIGEIKNWIKYNDVLMQDWGMQKKIKPGYRALFYGSPGTGKTLTATLIGKLTGRKVFRVDLSTVVSKYIGETEKNLATLFERAKDRDWVLFFDEADALFGKRTDVKDSHDRFANQEISYLLQRIEEFNGFICLASNYKSNMDEAFLRRFNLIIRFPFPKESERVRIWAKSFPNNVKFEKGQDFPNLLGKFELTGGNIINVVHHACLATIAKGKKRPVIMLADVLQGIRREVEKEGKVFKNLLDN